MVDPNTEAPLEDLYPWLRDEIAQLQADCLSKMLDSSRRFEDVVDEMARTCAMLAHKNRCSVFLAAAHAMRGQMWNIVQPELAFLAAIEACSSDFDPATAQPPKRSR